MPVVANVDLFRTVLEGLRTAVYVVDRDGKTLFWNDGAERITGYLRQDVVGRVCGDNFLGETDGEETESSSAVGPIAAVIREGKPIEAQISLRHKTGHRIPVQLWAFPIRNAQGAIVGVAESFEESVSVSDWDRRHTKLATYGCLDQASGVLNHGMVQAHLRVYTDRQHRAIAGLSMGGGQALSIGLTHPELFHYVLGFSAAIGGQFLNIDETIATVLANPAAANAGPRSPK